jgi:uncharacterized phiE125 gp8 family phage protein
MAAIKLITAPAVEPISSTEAKLHCRIDTTDDDALVSALIVAARERIEDEARHRLITQTWEIYLDAFPAGDVLIVPIVPLQSVTSITYYDEAGTLATFAATSYQVDAISKPARIALVSGQSWPSTTLRTLNGVVVRVVAGFGDTAATVPNQLRQAMLLLIEHWYENREPVLITGAMPMPIPMTIAAIVSDYRNRARSF